MAFTAKKNTSNVGKFGSKRKATGKTTAKESSFKGGKNASAFKEVDLKESKGTGGDKSKRYTFGE